MQLLVKFARRDPVCVELAHHVMEMLKLQLVMQQIINACVELQPPAKIICKLLHVILPITNVYVVQPELPQRDALSQEKHVRQEHACVERQTHAKVVRRHQPAMQQIISVFVEL